MTGQRIGRIVGMLIHFTVAELAEILGRLGAVVLVHVVSLLPASVTLAVVGYRRADGCRVGQAIGYLLTGNLLIVVPPIALIGMFGWWVVPILWTPHAILIWYITRKPHPPHAQPPVRHAQQYAGWPR